MRRSDHHDWASEAYVEEWVRRQRSDDPARAERFQLMCDLLPFPRQARATVLDVGAGYGPLCAFILERHAGVTCVGQDGSEPMLERAGRLLAGYGERFRPHRSDLFDRDWLPAQLGPFDAAVTSICLHNLRDFSRIAEIYREIRAHLRPGGVFLNLDLINAPTAALYRRYRDLQPTRREGAVEGMVAAGERRDDTPGPFPADLDQHLAALKAAGYGDVDCFWKDPRRALFGGYASG